MSDRELRAPDTDQTQLSLFQSSPSPLPLSAYLASALTGLNEQERENIFSISELISEICSKQDIALFEPRKSTDPVLHSNVLSSDVYTNDKSHVLESDLLIHLCHHPSTGSGEELEFARSALLPIILVAPDKVKVSRMVLGIPSLLMEVNYRSFDDLQSKLENVLFDIRPLLEERKLSFTNYKVNVVGQKILEIRQTQNLTRAEVAKASHKMTERRIAEIESKSDLESNPSLVELREIATILKTTVSEIVEPNFVQQVYIQLKAWTEGREAARTTVSEDDHKKLLRALLHRIADNIK
ncbi:hypothetical protein X750_15180 [Mesorhizobium sp. LNJC394B00]|nr:hypothetical protein X750_15180 [Mesorhizobium sp. LNJC394B00]